MTVTHDPMCAARDHTDMDVCLQCDLIRKVREDERGNIFIPGVYDRFRAEGYAAALRDAVEAVKALGHEQDCHDRDEDGEFCIHDDAVAAIEALGGER